MKNFFKNLIDSGNSAVEAHLILLCLGVVAHIGLSIYHVVCLRLAFDPNLYGQGLGCLLAGGGAAAWGQGLARSNEKDKSNEPDQ